MVVDVDSARDARTMDRGAVGAANDRSKGREMMVVAIVKELDL